MIPPRPVSPLEISSQLSLPNDSSSLPISLIAPTVIRSPVALIGPKLEPETTFINIAISAITPPRPRRPLPIASMSILPIGSSSLAIILTETANAKNCKEPTPTLVPFMMRIDVAIAAIRATIAPIP